MEQEKRNHFQAKRITLVVTSPYLGESELILTREITHGIVDFSDQDGKSVKRETVHA